MFVIEWMHCKDHQHKEKSRELMTVTERKYSTNLFESLKSKKIRRLFRLFHFLENFCIRRFFDYNRRIFDPLSRLKMFSKFVEYKPQNKKIFEYSTASNIRKMTLKKIWDGRVFRYRIFDFNKSKKFYSKKVDEFSSTFKTRIKMEKFVEYSLLSPISKICHHHNVVTNITVPQTVQWVWIV